MAAPTYHETTISRATGTQIVVNFPSTVNADDLLILGLVSDADNPGVNATYFTENTTSNFTFVGASSDNSVDTLVNVYYKVAAGNEGGGSVTFDHSASDNLIAFCIRLSGVDTTTPIYTTATTSSNSGGNSASWSASVAATAINDSMCFAVHGYDGADGDPFTITGTGWSKLSEADQPSGSTSGNDASGSVAYLTQSTAGTPAQPNFATGDTGDGNAAVYFVVQPSVVLTRTASVSGSGDVASYKTEGKVTSSDATAATVTTRYKIRTATVTCVGSGDVVAVPTFPRTADVTSTGSMSAAWIRMYFRLSSVAGSGDVNTIKTLRPSPVISSDGDVNTNYNNFYSGVATADGAGSLAAYPTYPRTVTAAGAGSLAAYPTRNRFVTVSADGDVTTNYNKIVPVIQRSATISASATVSSVRNRIPSGTYYRRKSSAYVIIEDFNQAGDIAGQKVGKTTLPTVPTWEEAGVYSSYEAKQGYLKYAHGSGIYNRMWLFIDAGISDFVMEFEFRPVTATVAGEDPAVLFRGAATNPESNHFYFEHTDLERWYGQDYKMLNNVRTSTSGGAVNHLPLYQNPRVDYDSSDPHGTIGWVKIRLEVSGTGTTFAKLYVNDIYSINMSSETDFSTNTKHGFGVYSSSALEMEYRNLRIMQYDGYARGSVSTTYTITGAKRRKSGVLVYDNFTGLPQFVGDHAPTYGPAGAKYESSYWYFSFVGNGVLTNKQPTATNVIAKYPAGISNVYPKGGLSVKVDVRAISPIPSTLFSGFVIIFGSSAGAGGSTDTVIFDFRTNEIWVSSGGGNYPDGIYFIKSYTFAADTWYTFQVHHKKDNEGVKLDVYVDGTLVIKDAPAPAANLGNIDSYDSFAIGYHNSGNSNAHLEYDNLYILAPPAKGLVAATYTQLGRTVRRTAKDLVIHDSFDDNPDSNEGVRNTKPVTENKSDWAWETTPTIAIQYIAPFKKGSGICTLTSDYSQNYEGNRENMYIDVGYTEAYVEAKVRINNEEVSANTRFYGVTFKHLDWGHYYLAGIDVNNNTVAIVSMDWATRTIIDSASVGTVNENTWYTIKVNVKPGQLADVYVNGTRYLTNIPLNDPDLNNGDGYGVGQLFVTAAPSSPPTVDWDDFKVWRKPQAQGNVITTYTKVGVVYNRTSIMSADGTLTGIRTHPVDQLTITGSGSLVVNDYNEFHHRRKSSTVYINDTFSDASTGGNIANRDPDELNRTVDSGWQQDYDASAAPWTIVSLGYAGADFNLSNGKSLAHINIGDADDYKLYGYLYTTGAGLDGIAFRTIDKDNTFVAGIIDDSGGSSVLTFQIWKIVSGTPTLLAEEKNLAWTNTVLWVIRLHIVGNTLVEAIAQRSGSPAPRITIRDLSIDDATLNSATDVGMFTKRPASTGQTSYPRFSQFKAWTTTEATGFVSATYNHTIKVRGTSDNTYFYDHFLIHPESNSSINIRLFEHWNPVIDGIGLTKYSYAPNTTPTNGTYVDERDNAPEGKMYGLCFSLGYASSYLPLGSDWRENVIFEASLKDSAAVESYTSIAFRGTTSETAGYHVYISADQDEIGITEYSNFQSGQIATYSTTIENSQYYTVKVHVKPGNKADVYLDGTRVIKNAALDNSTYNGYTDGSLLLFHRRYGGSSTSGQFDWIKVKRPEPHGRVDTTWHTGPLTIGRQPVSSGEGSVTSTYTFYINGERRQSTSQYIYDTFAGPADTTDLTDQLPTGGSYRSDGYNEDGWSVIYETTPFKRDGSGYAVAESSAGRTSIAYMDTGHPDPTIQCNGRVEAASPATDERWGIIFRITDKDNFYFAGIKKTASGYDAVIEKKVGASFTTLANEAVYWVGNNKFWTIGTYYLTYELRVRGNEATFYCYLPWCSGNDYTYGYNWLTATLNEAGLNSNTKHGFGAPEQAGTANFKFNWARIQSNQASGGLSATYKKVHSDAWLDGRITYDSFEDYWCTLGKHLEWHRPKKHITLAKGTHWNVSDTATNYCYTDKFVDGPPYYTYWPTSFPTNERMLQYLDMGTYESRRIYCYVCFGATTNNNDWWQGIMLTTPGFYSTGYFVYLDGVNGQVGIAKAAGGSPTVEKAENQTITYGTPSNASNFMLLRADKYQIGSTWYVDVYVDGVRKIERHQFADQARAADDGVGIYAQVLDDTEGVASYWREFIVYPYAGVGSVRTTYNTFYGEETTTTGVGSMTAVYHLPLKIRSATCAGAGSLAAIYDEFFYRGKTSTILVEEDWNRYPTGVSFEGERPTTWFKNDYAWIYYTTGTEEWDTYASQGRFRDTVSSGTTAFAVIDTGFNEVTITVSMDIETSSTQGGIVFRYVDNLNHYRLAWYGGIGSSAIPEGGTIRLDKIVGGSVTNLYVTYDWRISYFVPSQLTVKIVGDTVYAQHEYNCGTVPKPWCIQLPIQTLDNATLNAATKHGLYAYSNSSGKVIVTDNFKIYTPSGRGFLTPSWAPRTYIRKSNGLVLWEPFTAKFGQSGDWFDPWNFYPIINLTATTKPYTNSDTGCADPDYEWTYGGRIGKALGQYANTSSHSITTNTFSHSLPGDYWVEAEVYQRNASHYTGADTFTGIAFVGRYYYRTYFLALQSDSNKVVVGESHTNAADGHTIYDTYTNAGVTKDTWHTLKVHVKGFFADCYFNGTKIFSDVALVNATINGDPTWAGLFGKNVYAPSNNYARFYWDELKIWTDTGSGNLTTTYNTFFSGSATVSGAGSVSVTPTYPRTVTVAADGDVDTTYTKIVPFIVRSATISADGDVDTIKTLRPSPVISADGDIAATYSKIKTATATISGDGDVTAYKSLRPMPVISADGDIAATYNNFYSATATISGDGDVTAYKSLRPMPVISADGDVAATYDNFYSGTATISADGDVTAYPTYPRTATISADGDVTSYKSLRPMPVISGGAIANVVRYRILTATVNVSGAGNVDAFPTQGKVALITADGEVTANPAYPRTVLVEADGDVDTTYYIIKPATATISADGDVTAYKSLRPMPVISADGDIAATYSRYYKRTATASADGDITVTPTYPRTVLVEANGSVDTTYNTFYPGVVTITGTGNVSVTPTYSRTATISADGDVAVVKTLRPSSAISADGDVTVYPTQGKVALVEASGSVTSVVTKTRTATIAGVGNVYEAYCKVQGLSVAVGNTSFAEGNNDTGQTFSHTVGAGSNKILLVLWNSWAGVGLTSCTFGATSLTKLTNASNTNNGFTTEIWYATGVSGTQNITVNHAGGRHQQMANAIDLTNAGTPNDNTTECKVASISAATSSSLSPGNVTGDDYVLDTLVVDQTPTIGANQTSWNNYTSAGTSGDSSYQDGSNGAAMSWTFASASGTHVAVRIPAASSSVTICSRTAEISGAGSVAAYPTYPRTATISADGDVDTTRYLTLSRTASISADGDIAAYKSLRLMPTISADGSVDTTYTKLIGIYIRTATISADGDVTAYKSLRPMPVISADGDVNTLKTLRPMPVISADGDVTAYPTYPRTATISGDGDVTAYKSLRPMPVISADGDITVTPTYPRAVTISADGDVISYKSLRPMPVISGGAIANVVRYRILTALATASGVGSVAAYPTYPRTVLVEADGDVDTTYYTIKPSTATISADGDIEGHPTYPRTATVNAQGDVDTTARTYYTGAATITAEGNVNTLKTLRPSPVISADGDVTTTYTKLGSVKQRTATISADGDVTAYKSLRPSPVISADGDITAYPTYPRTVLVEANGDVTVTRYAIKTATATISGDGDVTTYKTLRPMPVITGGAIANVVRYKILTSFVTISGVGAVTVRPTYPRTALVEANGDVTTIYTRAYYRAATISADGDITAYPTYPRTATISADGDVNVLYNNFYSATASISASGNMSVTPTYIRAALIAADGNVTVRPTYPRTALVEANGDVTADYTRAQRRQSVMGAEGDVSAIKTLRPSPVISAAGEVTTNYNEEIVYTRTAILTGVASLSSVKLLTKKAHISGIGLLDASYPGAVTANDYRFEFKIRREIVDDTTIIQEHDTEFII